jgi:hypothetical protein
LVNLYQTFGQQSVSLLGGNDLLHFGELGAEEVCRIIAHNVKTSIPSLCGEILPDGDKLIFAKGGTALTIYPSYPSSIDETILCEGNVTINGTAPVHFNGGIESNYSISVLSNTIYASSIQADTLIIGSSETCAVPEPSMIALLLAGFGAGLYWHRMVKGWQSKMPNEC